MQTSYCLREESNSLINFTYTQSFWDQYVAIDTIVEVNLKINKNLK